MEKFVEHVRNRKRALTVASGRLVKDGKKETSCNLSEKCLELT